MALKKLGLVGGEAIAGTKDVVLRKMESLPLGQHFTLNITHAGGGGHTVVARNTADGVQVLDGQVNRDYLARSIADTGSGANAAIWEAVPLNGVRNDKLLF